MTLSELIERVEKLDGPSREVNESIFLTLGGKRRGADLWMGYTYIGRSVPTYTSSLDAAIALTERMLPGWAWRVATCSFSDDAWVVPDFNHPVHGKRLMRDFGRVEGDPSSYWQDITDVDLRPSGRPAIALVLAALRALRTGAR